MKENVYCVGGPQEYAGKVWTDADADEAGYLLLGSGPVDGPEAWYLIDQAAAPVNTPHGLSRVATYVADYLPG